MGPISAGGQTIVKSIFNMTLTWARKFDNDQSSSNTGGVGKKVYSAILVFLF